MKNYIFHFNTSIKILSHYSYLKAARLKGDREKICIFLLTVRNT